jgi:hypothetical protein
VGLYLCIFDGDDELDGLEIGSYSDFGHFRDLVAEELESGVHGRRYPVLMNHSDCDGEWSPSEAIALRDELLEIQAQFIALPPSPLPEGWKPSLTKQLRLKPKNLSECFFDIDGEPLLQRMIRLAERSMERSLPILFQ